jgi:hypothetical protein
MIRTVSTLAIVAGMLAGCAAPKEPYQIQTAYSDADFQPWAGAGAATLKGQAFMKTVGGDVKTCAGDKVSLIPATAYNKEVLSSGAGNKFANRDARADQYVRETTCDASGSFTFAGVPAQAWMVQSNVTWGVPTVDPIFHQATVSQQGGLVLKAVTLAAGDNSVIITGEDAQP